MKKILLLFTFSFFLIEFSFPQSPDWLWAKSAGGSSGDKGYGITTDSDNNIIITGVFYSPAIVFGTDTLTNAGIFIAKYDPNGNVLWAKCAGGNGWAKGNSITTDDDDNIIITGIFTTPNIIFGEDTLINTAPYCEDIFLVKYSPAGNVIWAKSAGGNFADYGEGVTTDNDNNIIITGDFMSKKIIFGEDTLIKTDTSSSASDIFIAKYDTAGNILWAKKEGGVFWDRGNSIVTDEYNNIAITGFFNSPSIVFGTDTVKNSSIFIAKYNSTGSILWARSAGSNGFGDVNNIITDLNNNIMVTGFFISPFINFGTDTLINTSTDSTKEIFLTKYDLLGNVLWAKSAGGSSDDYSNGITTDSDNNIIITGGFKSNTIAFGNDILTNAGYADIFMVEFDPAGDVLWTRSAGGSSDDFGNGITTDSNNNIIITGEFKSFTIAFGNDTLMNAGSADIFIAKLDINTSITENIINESIRIYPNPANDKITIEYQQSMPVQKEFISIYNMNGKLILKQPIYFIRTEIDISKLIKGLYLIMIENSKTYKIGKIIKL